MTRPRGAALVVGTQAVVVALVVGWFATGHSSAPDGGLQQLDVLSLHERVPGLTATRPTLVVAVSTCRDQATLAVLRRGTARGLPASYALVLLDPGAPAGTPVPGPDTVLPDPGGVITRALALGGSLTACRPGYALLDSAGYVRYRSYDPHLADHVDEQKVLLENVG